VLAVVLLVMFALLAAALVTAAVLLAISASSRRVITPGAVRAPARETVLPPSAAASAPAVAPRKPLDRPDTGSPAPPSAPSVAAIPASILAGEGWTAAVGGPDTVASTGAEAPVPEVAARVALAREGLIARVELGFDGSSERIGVRRGSSTESSYEVLAEELLGDLRRLRRVADASWARQTGWKS
jgi:hypothetical protein